MTSPLAAKHAGMVFYLFFSSNPADFCEECCTFGNENEIADEFPRTIHTPIPTYKTQPHYHGDLCGGICIPFHSRV